MRIYWRDLYIMDNSKIGVKEITAPFKGVCDHCKHLKIVRHYPYSWVKNFGVFCKKCYEMIDNELAGFDINYSDEQYE